MKSRAHLHLLIILSLTLLLFTVVISPLARAATESAPNFDHNLAESDQNKIVGSEKSPTAQTSTTFTVTQTSPQNANHNVPIDAAIYITFSQPISSTTVTSATFVVRGDRTARYTGTYTVTDNVIQFTSDTNFHPGEIIQAVVTTDIWTGGTPLGYPFVLQFRTEVKSGSASFDDNGQSLGNSNSGTVLLSDLDGDNDLDVFVSNVVGNSNANKVWLNNGNGEFVGSGQDIGNSKSNRVDLGDVDSDGDIDIFVANSNAQNEVWLNDGTGFFVLGQTINTSAGNGVNLGDLDGDGDLDAFFSNGFGANEVWLNDGTGVFSDSGQRFDTSNTILSKLGDVDNDGDIDIVTANISGSFSKIWFNDGVGNFSDSGYTLSSNPSLALGDLDDDGDLDAVVSVQLETTKQVWLNDGSGQFINSGQVLVGGHSQNVELGDLDGDGDLDIFCVNRFNEPNKVWLNDGNSNFIESGQDIGNSDSFSVALGDLDGNGSLDAFIGNISSQPNKVWLNQDIEEIAFYSSRDDNDELYMMDSNGENQVRLTNNSALDKTPLWSPDGSKIAFASTRSSIGIWIMNSDGSDPTLLLSDNAEKAPEGWSPDGQSISFVSNQSGNHELYRINIDGTGLVNLSNNTAAERCGDWSPAGDKIVFVSDRSGVDGIYSMNTDGSNVQLLASNIGFPWWCPDWSPDGSKIAYPSDGEIYVMDADGSNKTQITDNAASDYSPDWSPDGTKFVFTSDRDGNNEIYTMNVDGTNQVRITNNAANDDGATWKPDLGISPPINLLARTGLDAVLLTWNPSPSASVEGYHVYRKAADEVDFTRLTISSTANLSYRDKNAVSGTTYTYYATAVGDNGEESTPSNQVEIIFGSLNLTIPTVHVSPGDMVEVPVNIENADGLCIAAMDIGIIFDDQIAEVIDVQRTALTVDYVFEETLRADNEVHISSIGTTCEELHGPGTLFMVKFQVNQNAIVNSSLDFVRGLTGTVIYDDGDLFNPVLLHLVDGQLVIDGQYTRGDLNNDGVVNAADAAIALRIASGEIVPTPQQELAGDVNGDSVINAADASMILYYAAHQQWPPIMNLASLNKYSADNSVLVAPGATSGQAGGQIEVPVLVDSSADMAGGTMVVQYGDDLEFLSARLDDSLNSSDYQVAIHQTALRQVQISFAGIQTMSGGQQTLIWLRFQIDENATETEMWVDVTGAWLNDLNGRDFVISALQREVLFGQGNVQLDHKVFLSVVVR